MFVAIILNGLVKYCNILNRKFRWLNRYSSAWVELQKTVNEKATEKKQFLIQAKKKKSKF